MVTKNLKKKVTNATNTDEFQAFGITYAVTEDISVGFAESTVDLGASATDQVTQNVSFSYTMGGMSVTGSFIDQENAGGSTAAADDRKGYELGLAFAF